MTELKIMGIVFGAAILWFIYTIFIKDKLLQRKSIAGKVESILKKDMSSKYARCIFYMDNDYDNGYSQSEWLNLFKKSVADKEWDKNSKEYTEAVAPFLNAIVVADEGHYIRRGCEFIENTLTPFIPAHNDRISLNYFVEPYEYIKNEESAKAYFKARGGASKSEDEKAKEAARRRCLNCVHQKNCDWTVKTQTGPCGGYTPKERKGFLIK